MIKLPPLPYAYEALEPVVSSETLHVHHDKHHAKYVDVANQLIAEKGLEGKTLEEVIAHAETAGERKLFNNAAQAWNHAFFWESMTPDYRPPGGELARHIEQAFGGLAGLKAKFVETAANHFASGWAWLVVENGKLAVTDTHDAGTQANRSQVPLLVCDVWEHAYYIDYRQDRKAFLERWFDEVANWSFAAEQLAAQSGDGEAWRFGETV
jgi:Fe-Mn family superoxide dismutase